jgi:hypothetical protein
MMEVACTGRRDRRFSERSFTGGLPVNGPSVMREGGPSIVLPSIIFTS